MLVGNRGLNCVDVSQLFAAAYSRYAAPVLGYLRSQGVEDPEAVTQDVFLALYPRLTRIQGGEAGMRTLLFSIAHARVVDHHRRRSRSPVLVEYSAREDPRSTGSAEDHMLNGSTGALALLSTLPAEQRNVLALRIIADLSLDETAKMMDKTPGAIKQLQRRALIALKDGLGVDMESVP